MSNNPLNSFIFPLHPYKNKNKDDLIPFETRMRHSFQLLKSQLLYNNNIKNDSINTDNSTKKSFLINDKPKEERIDINEDNKSLSNVDNRFFNRGDYFPIIDRSHSRFTVTTQVNKIKPETFSYYYLPMKETNDKRKTLVLNLEGTIVNSENVTIRPQLKEFLRKMKYKYEIIIFSSLPKKEVNNIIEKAEISNYIDFILSKENYKEKDGILIKDIKRIGRNINEIVLIDDNLLQCEYNKDNSIPIQKWKKDKTDIELFKLIPLLDYLSKNDIRETLKMIITKNGIINWKMFEELKNKSFLKY